MRRHVVGVCVWYTSTKQKICQRTVRLKRFYLEVEVLPVLLVKVLVQYHGIILYAALMLRPSTQNHILLHCCCTSILRRHTRRVRGAISNTLRTVYVRTYSKHTYILRTRPRSRRSAGLRTASQSRRPPANTLPRTGNM